jgi:hypothetical protein
VLTVEVEKINNEIMEAQIRLTAAIEVYNERVDDARAFAEGVASEMDDYMSDRSDRWQESDAGSAYSAWKEEWENADFSPLDMEDLPTVEEPELTAAETLEQLPEEP